MAVSASRSAIVTGSNPLAALLSTDDKDRKWGMMAAAAPSGQPIKKSDRQFEVFQGV